jgi:hypothetical protein
VQLYDGAIDAGCQPEIVGIDDKSAHPVSLSSRCAASSAS